MNPDDIHPNALRFGVVLLAAGASSRMGTAKLLLPWGNGTILAHLLQQWHRLNPAQIAVVLAPAEDRIPAELDRLSRAGFRTDRVLNPDPSRGMFSSVQAAAAWTGWQRDLTHWLVSLGDQPLVASTTFHQLLEEAAQHPDCVCQPARRSRPRHPVIFPAALFRALPAATEENLKQFLANRAGDRHTFDSHDSGLDLDLDTPADYEMALAVARKSEQRDATDPN